MFCLGQCVEDRIKYLELVLCDIVPVCDLCGQIFWKFRRHEKKVQLYLLLVQHHPLCLENRIDNIVSVHKNDKSEK